MLSGEASRHLSLRSHNQIQRQCCSLLRDSFVLFRCFYSIFLRFTFTLFSLLRSTRREVLERGEVQPPYGDIVVIIIRRQHSEHLWLVVARLSTVRRWICGDDSSDLDFFCFGNSSALFLPLFGVRKHRARGKKQEEREKKTKYARLGVFAESTEKRELLTPFHVFHHFPNSFKNNARQLIDSDYFGAIRFLLPLEFTCE
jgi:hypothetical protein